MDAWTRMTRERSDQLWSRVSELLSFRPSVESKEWPSIKEPLGSRTFSLEALFVHAHGRPQFVEMGMRLNLAVLAALRGVVAQGSELCVLDWQHPCYLFRPYAEFEVANSSAWPVEVFPDGDYHFFLHPELKFGTFGHPWERTLCLFGKPLVDAFDPNSVPWLGPVVRIDGMAA